MLRCEKIGKQFDGVTALNEVTISVPAGSRRVIIGPNGAGKTTLFNIISGCLKPSNGAVFFSDKDITDLSEYKRVHIGIGRTFQINSLFSNLTILQNALLAVQGVNRCRYGIFRGINTYKKLHDQAEELLSGIGLWGKRHVTINGLSYGAQRQLEIILGLASKPKLLLLDEPTAGLSMEEGKSLLAMIGKLGAEITIILISHQIDLVLEFADLITVLHHGRVIFEGTSEEVQRHPKVMEIYTGIKPGS